MKRILLITTIFLLLLFSLSAEWLDGNGEWITSNVQDSGTANILVGFENKISDHIAIGFTGTEPSGLTASSEMPGNILTSVSLVDTNNGTGNGIASNTEGDDDEIYVFYQITSPESFVVSLELPSPLTAEDTSPVAYLGWNLEWSTPYESEDEYKAGEINHTESVGVENNARAPIYVHEPFENGYSGAGYKFIEIFSDDYRGKATGSYQGEVIVRIEVDGT